MRRGFACDVTLYGAELAHLLEWGDWRSMAFKEYLGSIKNELNSRTIMKVVADVSDSDDEG